MLNKKKIKAGILIKSKMGCKVVETTLIRNFCSGTSSKRTMQLDQEVCKDEARQTAQKGQSGLNSQNSCKKTATAACVHSICAPMVRQADRNSASQLAWRI